MKTEEREIETSPESTRLMLHLATALLVLVAFCALAATGAELIAAGRSALDRSDADRATGRPTRAMLKQPRRTSAQASGGDEGERSASGE